MEGTAGMYEFVGIGELAETTTHLLSVSLKHDAHTRGVHKSRLDQVGRLVLQQASDYLRRVREGFVLSVRASEVTHYREVEYLLDRVLTDWEQLSRELGLDDLMNPEPTINAGEAPNQTLEQRVERVRHQLLAFSMAVIALGYLPRLPSRQITFPHSYSSPPTYADIPVPSTPGEMLWRIEEIEQTVWRLMSSDLRDLVGRRYGSLRRTYGFFEASAWLSRKEAERFGIKKRQQKLSSF